MAGPYANFNPATDPYLNSIPGMKPGQLTSTKEDWANYAKGLGGMALGLPGDLANLVLNDAPRAIASPFIDALGGKQPEPLPEYADRFGTSQYLAKIMGADMDSQATQAGMFGLPGLEDIARVGGAKLAAMLANNPQALSAMTLFHGTPHSRYAKVPKGSKTDNILDLFSPDHAFTGEGAQAYGYTPVGYFAQEAGVAKGYQSKLSGSKFVRADGEVFDASDVLKNPNIRATIEKTDGDLDAALERVVSIVESIPGTDGARLALEDANTLQMLKASGGIKREAGHLLEVDIPDEVIAKYLDWDAPLSEQPESVRKGFNNVLDNMLERTAKQEAVKHGWPYMPEAAIPRERSELLTGRSVDEMTGREALETLYNRTVSREEASKLLNEAGIPGIRFLDGNSRTAGEGTRNIVPFNPDDIREVKRDGEVVFGGEKSALEKSREIMERQKALKSRSDALEEKLKNRK